MQIYHIYCNIIDILSQTLLCDLRQTLKAKSDAMLRHMVNDIILEIYSWQNNSYPDKVNWPYISHFVSRPLFHQKKIMSKHYCTDYSTFIASAVTYAFSAKALHPELLIFGYAEEREPKIYSCAVIEPKKVTIYAGIGCKLFGEKRFKDLTHKIRSPENEHWTPDNIPCQFIDIVIDSTQIDHAITLWWKPPGESDITIDPNQIIHILDDP